MARSEVCATEETFLLPSPRPNASIWLRGTPCNCYLLCTYIATYMSRGHDLGFPPCSLFSMPIACYGHPLTPCKQVATTICTVTADVLQAAEGVEVEGGECDAWKWKPAGRSVGMCIIHSTAAVSARRDTMVNRAGINCRNYRHDRLR